MIRLLIPLAAIVVLLMAIAWGIAAVDLVHRLW
jgi:hypothetical protein